MPKRQKADQYLTPAIVINKLMEFLPAKLPKGWVVEPSAGLGSFVAGVETRYPAKKKKLIAIEVDAFFKECLEESSAKIKIRDFLTWEPKISPVLVVGNPPYSSAQRFIEHSLQLTKKKRGVVAFLLRLAILEGKGRIELHKYAPLEKVVVLSNRPSFIRFNDDRTEVTETGTDMHAYGLFIWNWKHEGAATLEWCTSDWKKLQKEYEKWKSK